MTDNTKKTYERNVGGRPAQQDMTTTDPDKIVDGRVADKPDMGTGKGRREKLPGEIANNT